MTRAGILVAVVLSAVISTLVTTGVLYFVLWRGGTSIEQTKGEQVVRKQHDADTGSEPHIGRCHMGYCSWNSILKKELVKQVKDAVLYRIEVLGGSSGEYATSDEYPNKYDPSVSIKWDTSASTAMIFCYSRLPAVIFQNQVTVLNLTEVSGASVLATNLYVNVCHDADSYVWTSEKWLKKYGYGPPLGEEVTVDTPADLFGYVYDAEVLKDRRAAAAALQRGDYAEAVRLLRPLAEQGDAETQILLGAMYAEGEGVPQDYAEAVKWYRLAAEQGDADAQANLGAMYAEGQGVPQDDAEAVKWFRLAAEQGLALAQHNLGVMYRDGRGVPQDDAEVAKWYRLAAEQGLALAQFKLGIMYDIGQGVPQDYAEAVRWLRLAAEQGNLPAQLKLSIMYDKGEGVPQDYAEAASWYRLAAEQGNAKAQFLLGAGYAEGRGVAQDYAEAVKWYRLAAEQGDAVAQLKTGVMYDKGEGVPQDYAEAASWYRLAAEQGNAKAQFLLGSLYGLGRGVPRDYVQAHMWFNLAASRMPASKAKKDDAAVSSRDIVASKMTPAQLTEAQKLAREWKPK